MDDNMNQLEGWLEKQGVKGLIKGWKRRWFVVKENKLFYYKTKEDVKPTGKDNSS